MSTNFDAILDQAEDLTTRQLTGRISSLVRLKDSEIESLFPTKPDKQKLVELMKIVRASTQLNTRRRALIQNIDQLAGTVVKLLGKLA